MRAENRGCLFSDERDVQGSEVSTTYTGSFYECDMKISSIWFFVINLYYLGKTVQNLQRRKLFA